MGASTKRKELRKARFAHLHAENIVTPTNTSITSPSQPQSSIIGDAVPNSVSKNTEEQSNKDNSASLPDTAASSSKGRFICFIGNLPFSTTTEKLTAHFRKVSPTSIRHSTNKDTGKSRGFAFLEFDGYDRMKTCLKLYHHSLLDDGISPPRKINVELTAGGGGSNSDSRRAKLRMKNDRLEEQRKRRAATMAKGTEKNEHGPSTDSIADDDVHPSRRRQILS